MLCSVWNKIWFVSFKFVCRMPDSKCCVTYLPLVNTAIFDPSGFVPIFILKVSSSYVTVLPPFNFQKSLTYLTKSTGLSTYCWGILYLAGRLSHRYCYKSLEFIFHMSYLYLCPICKIRFNKIMQNPTNPMLQFIKLYFMLNTIKSSEEIQKNTPTN